MKALNNELFSFRNRYIPALLIIALFSILGFINVKDIISSIRNEGKIINTSGRQRMLSQKLLLLVHSYLNNPNNNTKNQVLENIQTMENAHHYLIQNSDKRLIELLYFNNNLDFDLKNYLTKAKQILETSNSEDLSILIISSDSLLKKLDEVVKIYEEEYEKKLVILQNKGEYLLLGIFIVLLFEWILIFKPASKNIKLNIEKLEDEINSLSILLVIM